MSANVTQEDESALGAGGPRFSPPLYKQRYSAVLEVARKLQCKKVVDYGCAECKLLKLLKKEEYVEELVGVDLDTVPLLMHCDLVRPLITDHLHPRPRPLHMALMQGSIALPDARLVDFDLLTCVEVLEHLEQPVLDAVPPAVFGYLRPQVVVMTTPNAEYNVLFPGFSGFRHHDHKFEWTRGEFRTWCNEVCRRYDYEVEYGGVGDPPPGREDVGPCSQMATFTCSRKEGRKDTQLSSYKMVAEATHPYQTNPLTVEQKLRLECEYYCYILLKSRQWDSESVEDVSECRIPLKDLLVFPRVKALCTGVEEIRCVLKSSPSPTIWLDATADCAVLPVDEPDSGGEEESDDVSEEQPASATGSGIQECWD